MRRSGLLSWDHSRGGVCVVEKPIDLRWAPYIPPLRFLDPGRGKLDFPDHRSRNITPACADSAVEQVACFAVVVAAACASVPDSGSVADDAAPSAAVSVGSHFALQPADPLSAVAAEVSGAPCSADRSIFAAASGIAPEPAGSPIRQRLRLVRLQVSRMRVTGIVATGRTRRLDRTAAPRSRRTAMAGSRMIGCAFRLCGYNTPSTELGRTAGRSHRRFAAVSLGTHLRIGARGLPSPPARCPKVSGFGCFHPNPGNPVLAIVRIVGPITRNP